MISLEMGPGRKIGRVCEKHPELKGLRYASCCSCILCKKERTRAQRTGNRRELYLKNIRDAHNNRAANLKREVINYYGMSCLKCDIADIDVLNIDHIDGSGAAHRRELRGKPSGRAAGGYDFYKWLKRNGFPLGFRVLCFNCNFKEHLERTRALRAERDENLGL